MLAAAPSVSPHFTILDTIVLLLYFAATIGIGLYHYRKSSDADVYVTGGRSMPGWAVGLSIFGTYLSSITFLADPGQGFATNWNLLVFSFALPICAPIAVYYFLPYYRKSGHVSAYAMLEARFGIWARLYATIFFMISQVVRIGMVSYLMALAIQIVLGWDMRTVIIVTGVITTAYAFVGGIVAVVWTDVMQSIVLLTGAIFSLVFILWYLPGGPTQMVSIAMANHKFGMGPYSMSLMQQTFWIVLINGVLTNLANFGVDQKYVQRYILSRSDAEARKSVWIGALLYVPASALFFLIGTALYAYYQTHAGDLPDWVAARADRVYSYFIVSALPPGVTGLLLAALFAAAMSGIGSCLNAFATLAHDDIFKRLIAPRAGERTSLYVLYAMTILAGIFGMLIAIVCAERQTDTVLKIWWKWSGILSGGTLGLFLIGFMSRRAGNAAAGIALTIGTIAFAWMTWCKSYPDVSLYLDWQHRRFSSGTDIQLGPLAVPLTFRWHDLTIATTGTIVMLLAGYVASLIVPRKMSRPILEAVPV